MIYFLKKKIYYHEFMTGDKYVWHGIEIEKDTIEFSLYAKLAAIRVNDKIIAVIGLNKLPVNITKQGLELITFLYNLKIKKANLNKILEKVVFSRGLIV